MSQERREQERAARREEAISAPRRLKTGIPGLDAVLHGGIPNYAVVVIAGQPGSGKTILAQQMIFSNLENDQRCVYLTTVSESPMKAARYQSQFSFFDPDKFGTQVIYMDVDQIIRTQGLRKSLDTIMDSLRDVQPTIVVIDSFKAVHDLAPSPQEMRSFIYDISVELAAMQTTSFLVGEYSSEDIATQPEFAIADGIIWLYTEARDTEISRYLRVLKMRGIEHSTSAHNFDITRNGIDVYSIEGLIPTTTAPYRESLTRTGIQELDELLRGGIPRGAPMLLTGGAGTGKSTLCLQYLYEGAVRYGEKGIYFSYEEPVAQIIANSLSFGWDLQKLIDEDLIRIYQTPLPDINPNKQLISVMNAIREFGAQRAAIDSLTMMLTKVSNPDLIRSFVYYLTAILKEVGCTTLITSDPPTGSQAISRFGVEESIIDGVILLKLIGEKRARVRYIEIYKVRGINHASGDNVMKITSRGIQIFPRVQEAME